MGPIIVGAKELTLYVNFDKKPSLIVYGTPVSESCVKLTYHVTSLIPEKAAAQIAVQTIIDGIGDYFDNYEALLEAIYKYIRSNEWKMIVFDILPNAGFDYNIDV